MTPHPHPLAQRGEVASDEQVAVLTHLADGYLTKEAMRISPVLIRRILNRLTTAERERDEARKELEWRGLLVKAASKYGLRPVFNSYVGRWELGNSVSTNWIAWSGGQTVDQIPACPDDATVKRIEEAINGAS